MTPNSLLDSTLDDEPEIPMEDPEIPADRDEPEIPAELPASIEPAGQVPETAIARLPLMDVLPADFALPLLIKFVPDPAWKVAADEATRYALSVDVRGAEGLQAADDGMVVLRGAQKVIQNGFEEPVALANALHKNLTVKRGEWLQPGAAALDTVGRKVYVETQRLKALADEERRKAQAKADEQAREDARKRAAAAEQAKAPAAVVETLKAQAETMRAAPVSVPASAPPKLTGTSTVENWKGALAGTPRDGELNPDMSHLTPAQVERVHELMRAVLEGKAPLVFFDLNWSEINRRTKAEKSTFAVAGLEALDCGGTRAKGSRSK